MHPLVPLLTDAAIQADKLRLARLLTDALDRDAGAAADRQRLIDQRNGLIGSLRGNLRAA